MTAVKGTMMIVLKEYVVKADPDEVEARITQWVEARDVLKEVADNLDDAETSLARAFEETSLTTAAATSAFRDSSKRLREKVKQLDDAVKALGEAQTTTRNARRIHDQLEASLPAAHGPAPDPSDSRYSQSGTGVDAAQATQNQKALQADRAAHAARQQAIADAEAAAAQQIDQVDESNYTAEPPVREITDEPSTETSKPPAGVSSPGSYSDVQAARARMAQYNSGTLYPGGMGHELIAQEKANIAAAEAQNTPEWNGKEWINADGSAAPATSYAMVETADGLAPMAGGTGGMTALAIGGGGALLGAGVAKALANKFAGGTAKTATAGATSRSAAARSAAAKAGSAGARAGAGAAARGTGTGAGARGARGAGTGAGARGSRGGATGAGSRAGRGGAGAGAGRGSRKKDNGQNSQDQDWQADYTDDWTENASDVLDPSASRGWVPTSEKNKREDRR